MEKNNKIIYESIQINPQLLADKVTPEVLEASLTGEVNEVLPKSKLIGIYYLSYIKEVPAITAPPILGGKIVGSLMALPEASRFSAAHTKIRIEDTQGILVTEPVDIQDFYYKRNGGIEGFKKVEYEITQNEKITITWESKGDNYPPCGEFIFILEKENVC